MGVTSVAMSTGWIGQRRQRRAHDLRVERRQVALQIDDDVMPPFRIDAFECLEDPVRARRMIGPGQDRRPPAAVTAARSPARRRRRRPGRRRLHRCRHTWTIIGSPPMSASGLPGSRVDAMRAGTRTIGLCMCEPMSAHTTIAPAIHPSAPLACHPLAPGDEAIEGQHALRLLCRRRVDAGHRKEAKMHFSLLEKIGASALLCAWLVFGSNFSARCSGARARTRTNDGSGEGHGRREAWAASGRAGGGSRHASRGGNTGRGREGLQQVQGLPRHREGRPNKVGPNLCNVVGGPKAHMQGFAYSDGLAGCTARPGRYQDLDAFLANPK